MYICVYTLAHKNTNKYKHKHTHTYTDTHPHKHSYTQLYKHICMHTNTYRHMPTHTHVRVCIHPLSHPHTHIHTHTHAHAHTHTHAHTEAGHPKMMLSRGCGHKSHFYCRGQVVVRLCLEMSCYLCKDQCQVVHTKGLQGGGATTCRLSPSVRIVLHLV